MHPTSPDSQTLQREHAALLAAYGQAQSHCSRLLAAQAARILYLESEAMRLRAAVILRDSALAWEREDRKALETSIPGLPRRVALARSVMAHDDLAAGRLVRLFPHVKVPSALA